MKKMLMINENADEQEKKKEKRKEKRLTKKNYKRIEGQTKEEEEE